MIKSSMIEDYNTLIWYIYLKSYSYIGVYLFSFYIWKKNNVLLATIFIVDMGEGNQT